jgi:hypothetical protein
LQNTDFKAFYFADFSGKMYISEFDCTTNAPQKYFLSQPSWLIFALSNLISRTTTRLKCESGLRMRVEL